ncbi:MAG: carotenoid biosynthesis protein [Crocinitomicaceae bacterium]|nr:carotenoid biosynthesis protein [Crocinitomicaceae bacterium]
MTKNKASFELKDLLKMEIFWIVLITIFFAVGTIGIALPEHRDNLVRLSSFHLLLTFIVLYYSRKDKKDKFFLFAFLIFVLGILVESIGTNTGILFGDYKYGTTLGAKVFGVPLIIGVNWATMVVCSSTLVYRLKLNLIWKSVLAAILMTSLDFLIEPVAVKLDFWSWARGEIPIYNYICWFVISLPMHYFYMKWNLVENNSVPKAVFILLAIFFLVLNFV